MSNTSGDKVIPSRCAWAQSCPDLWGYHDNEWGFPVNDDRILFEKISLEIFQSGLSWRTIFMKRENFRKAFKNFEIVHVSSYTKSDIEKLLFNKGIVRHRGKIESIVNNAREAKLIIEEFGSLARFFWMYEPDPKELPMPSSLSQSELSKTISKELKKRGWKYIGPTTVYSFMQAIGLVNDHAEGCFVRSHVQEARKKFSFSKSYKTIQ